MDEEPVDYVKLFIIGVVFLLMAWAAFAIVTKAGSWIQPGPFSRSGSL